MNAPLETKVRQAREQLDAQVREIVHWHFSPETGTPVLAGEGQGVQLRPAQGRQRLRRPQEVRPSSRTTGSAAARCAAGCPRGSTDKPIYVFETGGTTGIPKSRVVVDDFRIDYEMFSDTLPDKYFPKGSNWLMLGPSGPRRLRLAVEHLCQYRGGICFCVDLDPRWVIKLIKKGWMEHLKAYQEHCIDQAMTILSAGHDIKCMFTTPKLLDALCKRLEKEGSSIAKAGITGIFCGGTEMTPQWIRFAIEEYLGPDVYIAPTYGNTLMGLAASEPCRRRRTTTRSPTTPRSRGRWSRWWTSTTTTRWCRYGQTGRVHADDADEGVLRAALPGARRGRARAAVARSTRGTASAACKPFHEIAATTTVGVY